MNVLNDGILGETYNIGANEEIENIEVINKICSILDKQKPRKNKESYKKLVQKHLGKSPDKSL